MRISDWSSDVCSSDLTAQEERTEDDFNIDDYLQDDDRSDYAEMMSYGGDDDEDRKEIPIAVGVSFYDDLEKQLNLVKLDGRHYVMAIQIIGSIEDRKSTRLNSSH